MMRYEILHGNVRERYENVIHTIPEEWAIPQDVDRAVSSSLERLKGIPNRCLVPIDTDDGVKLLYSVCCDKMNALSPSYYVHKQLIDCSVEDLLNGFHKILRTPVYSEEEFDRIAAGERGVQPTDKWGQGTASGNRSFSPKAMRAVLYGILDRWQSGSQPVYIGVPAGVDYDAYCFEAINRIYGLLPAGIRGRVGFMTYGRAVPMDVAVCFVPEGSANDPVLLDREPERSRTQLGSGLSQEMKDMVDHVIELDRTKQDYKAYLKDLYVQIEQGLRLDEIQSETYETMLWIQNLGKGLENRQNFDRLRDRFKEYKTLSPKVQNALVDILKNEVKNDILEKHLLQLPGNLDELPHYAQKLESYASMLSYSPGKIGRICNRLIEKFKEIVNQNQNDLEVLIKLNEFLVSVEEKKYLILNGPVLENMGEALKDPFSRKAEQYVDEALDKVDELHNSKDVTFNQLSARVKTIRDGLTQELERIPDIPEEDIQQKRYNSAENAVFSDWHWNNAIKIEKLINEKSKQELTEQVYQAARNELLGWEARCAQESWKKEYQRVRRELEKKYTDQGGDVKQALKEKVYEEPNYFCALAALEKLESLLPPESVIDANKHINGKIPTSVKGYQEKYAEYAGNGKSVEWDYQSDRSAKVRERVPQDLHILYRTARFKIQNKHPREIQQKIDQREVNASRFVQWEKVVVYLSGSDEQKNGGRTIKEHEYNAQRLNNTLGWILYWDTPDGNLLPDDQIAALLLQMRDMDMALGQTIQIAENMFRKKPAVKQIVEACVELLLKKGIRSDAESERGLENRLGMIGYPDLYQKLRAKKEQEEAGIVGTGGFLSGWLGSIDWRDIGTGVVYWMIVLSLFVGAFFVGNKHFEPDQASAESYSDAASPVTGGEIAPPETTAPSETTVPPETTVPSETTVPPETTPPADGGNVARID